MMSVKNSRLMMPSRTTDKGTLRLLTAIVCLLAKERHVSCLLTLGGPVGRSFTGRHWHKPDSVLSQKACAVKAEWSVSLLRNTMSRKPSAYKLLVLRQHTMRKTTEGSVNSGRERPCS
jgi:hypothetical protein